MSYNEEEVHDYDDEFGPGDFGFIIGPNGELKSITIPENLMEDPPKSVKRIMKIFGIRDLQEITVTTIH